MNVKYIFKRLVQKKPIVVPGRGRPIIHFGHIDDLTSAIMKCILKKESFGQIYNVAGDSYITFKGWIESCAEAVNICPDILLVESNEVGFQAREWFPFRDIHLFGSVEKMKNQLGIYPRIDLVHGLRDTFDKTDNSLLKEPILHSKAELSILDDYRKNLL